MRGSHRGQQSPRGLVKAELLLGGHEEGTHFQDSEGASHVDRMLEEEAETFSLGMERQL